jgi:hypothetical protein
MLYLTPSGLAPIFDVIVGHIDPCLRLLKLHAQLISQAIKKWASYPPISR